MTERIVVGIDGSPGAQAALTWAVDEAARRDATLEVVHAWHAPFVDGYGYAGSAIDPVAMELGARAVADEAVEPHRGKVAIDVHVVCGSPASVLVQQAKDADLLVVGSRGRGGFAGLLLGSVSHQVVHHAPCPVVVVPEHE
jgi:nucleotide-binding universal stress UspA family protein